MNVKPWKHALLAAFSLVGSAAFAQVQNAQKAIELQRFGEAKHQLLPQSQNADAAFELGRLYQMQEMPDSAAYFFNAAARDPKSPMSTVAAGRAFLAQGKRVEAEIQFDKAVKDTKGKDAKVLTAIGQAYAESNTKENQKGIEYLNQALKVYKKDDPATLIALGDIYQKDITGGGQAMNMYERALLADPNYVQAHYRKGQLSVRSRQGDQALTSFQKAIELNPNYAPAYVDLAELYYFAKRYDEAAATMQKYVSMAERTPATDAKYAAFLYLSKKYPEAEAQIQKVLAKDPNNVTMKRLQAYVLFETGKNDEALAAMDQYFKTTPANKVIADDYVNYGKILSKAGRYDEGIAAIKKAIEVDPNKAADLQNELALAYLSKKDYPNAIKVYTAKLKSGKGELTDNVYLARAYTFNNQFAQADSVYNVVLTARPNYVPGYQMRAVVNANMDPTSEKGLAKPFYEKYIELASADPTKYKDGLVEANRYLGSYYLLNKNDKQTSLPYWQKVLELAPGDAGATKAISEINGKPKTAAAGKK